MKRVDYLRDTIYAESEEETEKITDIDNEVKG
jgi:hypothetical protein